MVGTLEHTEVVFSTENSYKAEVFGVIAGMYDCKRSKVMEISVICERRGQQNLVSKSGYLYAVLGKLCDRAYMC